jgi:oligo-1,6-glucosidase
LNYFRRIVKLRKDNAVLVYGKYTLLDKSNPDVYTYTRELDGKKFLVLLNFRSEVKTANTGLDLSKARVLIDNYTEPSTDGKLKPYEAVVYQLL